MERTPEPLGKALEEVPPPEGELAKVAGGTGPRSELDPALGFVLDNFKVAVGLEGSVPTAEEVESWALALEKCEPALLHRRSSGSCRGTKSGWLALILMLCCIGV